MRAAGWSPVCAVDMDAVSLETYSLNFPSARTLRGDLRDPAVQEELLSEHAGVDGVVGGPPCQGFSSLHNVSGARYDEMNRLPMTFASVALSLSPRVIFMEEVPRAASVVRDVAARVVSAGYAVWTGVLDASLYGVAQRRKRLLLVAVRGGAMFEPPLPGPALTVAEALSRAPAPAWGRQVSEYVRRKILEYDERGRRAGQYEVMDVTQPARTVTTQTYSNTGPYTQKRAGVYYELSLQEAARLQSFPPDFVLAGSVKNQRKQLGNAVPPELMRRVAMAVILP